MNVLTERLHQDCDDDDDNNNNNNNNNNNKSKQFCHNYVISNSIKRVSLNK